MLDTISIRGLHLFAKHGVFSHEREAGQKFIIDVECQLQLGDAIETDSYAETVCYNKICQTIADVSDNGPYNLIETFAAQSIKGIFARFPEVQTVDICVKKPDAPVDFDIDYASARLKRQRKHRLALAFGSNVGDKIANLRTAIAHLKTHSDLSISAISEFYQTQPVGPVPQDDYINACAIGETRLAPFDVLRLVKGIELTLGRTPAQKWGPREIDIDILCHGHTTVLSPDLTLPHPHMFERLFVLQPLADIAPDWQINDKSVQEHFDLRRAASPQAALGVPLLGENATGPR